MEDAFERLSELSEGEVRVLLNDLLKLTTASTKQGDGEHKALADSVRHLYSKHVERAAEAEQRKRTVHIMFSLSDAGSLKVTLSKLGKRMENEVLAFNDCFSTGPINELVKAEGQRSRESWLSERFSGYLFNHHMNHEHKIGRMIERIAAIAGQKSIVIWCGDNAHEQVGLRFVMHLLKGRENEIRMMNGSLFYRNSLADAQGSNRYYALGLLEPELFLKMVECFEQAELLSEFDRQRYEAEWLELAQQKSKLRLWENGQIKHAAENELDKRLMDVIGKLTEDTDDGFVKAGAVVGEIWGSCTQLIDYPFIEYRLWTLISDGYLAFRGLPGAMHQYAVKLNSGRILA
ncbi:DUF1835 domain-containing protein [Paenibacillus sp. FJAT-27812]|uniref:DUF1835 domain-containing protein n=1 Tax=Paenibacillus sp. FJAT-27812 TaxID=1684143 RepID=UPI0006A785AD|nr:DUF1835 domain-containing protein [Paenibacillus sp. FJAT-27812]